MQNPVGWVKLPHIPVKKKNNITKCIEFIISYNMDGVKVEPDSDNEYFPANPIFCGMKSEPQVRSSCIEC